MKLAEQNNEIILRDIPAQNWARGVVCLAGAVIFGGAASIKLDKQTPHPIEGGQIFCLALALFFLYWTYKKLSMPATITRVKPGERFVEITKRRFLIINKTERFTFAQIKRFELIQRKPDRAFLYFNVLILQNDSLIELESDGNAVEGTARIVSVRLNEILRKVKYEKQSKNQQIRARKTLKKKAKDESGGKMS